MSDSPQHPPATADPARTNWAGNYTFRAADLVEVTSVEHLQQLVRSRPRIKALGARHSFNHIADTPGTQISVRNLRGIELDRQRRTVTVGPGITYGELAPWLDAHGLAVPNIASLPHISVVGACATATHGSGLHNGCLSTSVSALQLVNGSGELVHLSRAANPDIFPGAVVGLGALGIVTAITLDLVPSFQMAQTVYENLSFDQLEHNLQAIFGAAYSVSLFTLWQNHRATQVWIKRKLDTPEVPASPELFFGATLQTRKLHPLPGHSAENCTEQLGLPGPSFERLPHFRMDYTPSSGAELQTEFFVPLDRAFDAILALEQLRDRITPLLYITELRTVAADDLWLGTAFGRPSLGIHFTWKQQLAAVLDLLPAIQSTLEPFGARPHWAKLFTLGSAQLRSLYPKFADFAALRAQFDPDGRFRNEFLDEVLG
ncbi:MAG TPA: D-arabinono-1,4-lactone oxidase [Acidobacteriaceae bacterium]|jgi:xylitol oxidase|nr:D-arabinono-1,4-lactone oxidase [Acidobacteriaceae bacterium]